MGLEPQPAPVSTPMLWTGRIISALPALLLLFSGVMKVLQPTPAPVAEGLAKFGYPEGAALGLGILELACTAAYILPRTAFFGAVLLTGYLGGAIATHVRLGEPVVPQVVLGMMIWLGLYLREERLRGLLPLWTSPGGRTPVLLRIFLALVAVVVLAVVIVALQPAHFEVERSATIAAAPAQVFAMVNDYHNWQPWSPWADLDPACKYTYEGASAGKGAAFAWSGNDKVGEGRMTTTESRPNELIQIKLDFVKPFESSCTTKFTFRPAEGNQTVVTWNMSGENNLVGKAFCMFMDMDQCVGGDFERGLARMKKVAEDAARK